MVLLTSATKTPPKSKKKCLWCISLGALCLMLAVVYMATDPVQIVTRWRMQVANVSVVQEFLNKPMQAIKVATYLFNITNAERFLSGEDHKLKIEEVGPFTYKETRYNDNLEIDLEAGVIRYEPRFEVEFIPEQSIAHPDDVNVTMPNLPMLGLTSTMSTYPYWTRMGWNLLTSQLNSKAILTMNASTYLWGYKEPLVTLAHNMLPGFVSIDKIGILDRVFDKKIPNRLEVSARDEDKFMVKTKNGHGKLAMGNNNPDECEVCDDFSDAYEGFMYPSGLTPEFPINIYRNGLCRILTMIYHDTVTLDNGVQGLVYNLSDSFYSLDPNVTENRLLELEPCYFGLPFALSKAHFLDHDPKIYERIEGIKPDPKKNCYTIIEPKVALALETYFPVQMNLLLKDMSFNSVAARFSNMVLPVGYVEVIQVPTPVETLDILYMLYVIFPTSLLVAEVLLVTLGLLLISYSAVVFWRSKKKITAEKEKMCTQEPLLVVKA